MINVALQKVVPFAANFAQNQKTDISTNQESNKGQVFASYNAENLRANFMPMVSFKGLHHDSLMGVETLIIRISDYQDNAKRVKYRRIGRLKKGEKRPIPLKLEREPEHKFFKNSIAVYHEYDGKKMKLGYLAESMANQLAPLMDKNYKFNASVVNVAGGTNESFPYIGIRMRLEYTTSKDRSPNYRKINRVKKAFERCLNNGSAKSYTYKEETIVDSKEFARSTKLRLDEERGEATVYRKGWEQLRGPIAEKPGQLKNSRKHPQDQNFVEHAENSVDIVAKRKKKNQPPQQMELFKK